jgi:hypothetical protein
MELTILLVFLIILAGFIKGFVGFGLSLILITVLLSLGFAPTQFLPILVPLFVILDCLLLWENRKNVNLDFKENFTLHPATLMTLFIGVLLGTALLMITDGDILKLFFAFTVLVMIMFLARKVNNHQMKIPNEKDNSFFGFGSGMLTGLFTLNAVPVSLYLLYHQYPKEKYMGALVTFLIFSDIILVAVYLFQGLFSFEGFIISAQLLLLVLIGFAGGVYLRKHLSSSKFKAIVIFILAVNSFKIIFDYFWK